MRRAGRVRGVDPERHARQAAVPELRERAMQERLRVTASAKLAPDPERADVTAAVPVRLVARDGRDLAVTPDQEPQAEIEIRVRRVALPPLRKRRRVMLPVVPERRVKGVVERLRLLRLKA